MSKLQFIKNQTFDEVATVNITDVFSSDYRNYLVITKDFANTDGNNAWISLRLINASDAIITSSTYDIAQLQMMSDQAFGENRYDDENRFKYSISYSEEEKQNAGQFIVSNPYESALYTHVQRQSTYFYTDGGRIDGYRWIGMEKTAVSVTGFNLYSEDGYDFEGEVNVYGIK
jgi:hypothetical protein